MPLTQINKQYCAVHKYQPCKFNLNAGEELTMEDKIVARNMAITIGIIMLVAVGLITLSSIIGKGIGM
tara:strand:+ start:74684 stop:74887 length:204 start_codon:yes stop_codon:yes gene_type:complete